MNRDSYAFSAGTISVGTDPTQFVTRQMYPTMDLIYKDLHKLLINSVQHFHLSSVDLTQQFKYCTMLIYYPDGSLKRSSSLGFHVIAPTLAMMALFQAVAIHKLKTPQL